MPGELSARGQARCIPPVLILQQNIARTSTEQGAGTPARGWSAMGQREAKMALHQPEEGSQLDRGVPSIAPPWAPTWPAAMLQEGPGAMGQSGALQLGTRLCRSTACPTCWPHMPNDSPTLLVPLENDPVNYLHFTAEEAQLQSSCRARGPAGQEHCTERSVGQRHQIHGHGPQKHRSSKTHLAPSHAETRVSTSCGFGIFGSASPAVLLKASPLEDSSARPPKEPGIAVHH